MRGAGGSDGGAGQFLIGLAMLVGGFYLLFSSIVVTHSFGLGYRLYGYGGYQLTTGMVLIPLIFGVGIIFYNARHWVGWLLAAASLLMLVFGVIASIQFRMRLMSAFDLILILVLLFGGLGLFLRSLRSQPR